MATEITMPRLSDSMEEGTILKWLVDKGGEVKKGEPLVEIETDKANMTYDADADGTLIEVLAKEGDTLAVGEAIARIGDASEADGDGSDRDDAKGESESDDGSEADGGGGDGDANGESESGDAGEADSADAAAVSDDAKADSGGDDDADGENDGTDAESG